MKRSPRAEPATDLKPPRASEPSWEITAASVVVTLLIFTELLPVVFGTGTHATYDWSALYLLMRSMVIPGLAIAVILAVLARLPRSRARALWTRIAIVLTCAGVVLVSWVYQLPPLGR